MTPAETSHERSFGTRLKIAVGVSYRSEPEMVMGLLAAIAAASPGVLQHPAPEVTFDNFGSRALEFTLHVSLAEGVDASRAATGLRLAIWKTFKAAAIEMPYDQLDVHLRDLDAVRAVVARVLANRQTGATPPPGDPEPA